MYILLTLIIVGVIVLGIAGVVAYFNSGARTAKKELKEVKISSAHEIADANERVAVAQTALIEIAGGHAMPIMRASDALSEITNTYTRKEIN